MAPPVLLGPGCRQATSARPVIFIGLDGADWNLLDRYIAEGAMPNLAALAREGRAGTVTTLHPALSPLVWTTMMTGAAPLEHGILDFTRFNPSTGVKEPITSDERRAPAIWNMASAAGKSVAVFGMWATYPAEPVRGLLVSDRLFSFQYGEKAPPPGIVHPPGREEWARQALGRAEDGGVAPAGADPDRRRSRSAAVPAPIGPSPAPRFTAWRAALTVMTRLC